MKKKYTVPEYDFQIFSSEPAVLTGSANDNEGWGSGNDNGGMDNGVMGAAEF